MTETEQKMHESIRSLFEEDLKLLEHKVPTNGIWAVRELLDTGYQGAIRILPSGFAEGEYSLWVDVFQTIYDPVYSNTLVKGSLSEIRDWLGDESHIHEVYECMHHLHELAVQGL